MTSEKLIAWYTINKRPLPWRATDDPYHIWLSEVILQQTRVDQGMEYYLDFTECFPTVFDLSAAGEDEVLKHWQGLGYYSRARNLHATAKIIANRFGGKFPEEYNDLIHLPGIGPYTAAAIASIAFKKPVPVVDGNVLRVISRWFALDVPANSPAGKKKTEEILLDMIDPEMPGDFNQALMEFGAVHCKPVNPGCDSCIFNPDCLAFIGGKVDHFPVRQKKIERRTRFFWYLFVETKTNDKRFTLLKKRTGNDIWKGLYDLPLIESETDQEMEHLLMSPLWKNLFGEQMPHINHVSGLFKHQLTHQQIHARFLHIKANAIITDLPDNYVLTEINDLSSYPVPRLLEQYFRKMALIR